MNQHPTPPRSRAQRQHGGFAVGLIVGLLIGLGLALGVALYVTKVPVPFINKVPQRSAGQDAAEAEKNKNWDPNSPLYGKNPARPGASASGVVPPAAPVAGAASVAVPAPRASMPARDPAAILADRPASMPTAASTSASGPKGFTASTLPGAADPFVYFVQAGAYARTEDAEQQRAKLAMMGLEGKLSERDQAGHIVYRVRIGPFDKKADADAAKETLVAAGVDAAMVRVQR